MAINVEWNMLTWKNNNIDFSKANNFNGNNIDFKVDDSNVEGNKVDFNVNNNNVKK